MSANSPWEDDTFSILSSRASRAAASRGIPTQTVNRVIPSEPRSGESRDSAFAVALVFVVALVFAVALAFVVALVFAVALAFEFAFDLSNY